ncbi:murein hydrolase activator EnvC family protein, partial [Plastoroseomonas hellenica]|uniref:murein hydrolase activator EnvC family protein n=1 Tax=Plastoroseomonas hellenica TaxID=2687306 RepID=UPI001BA9ABA4
RAEPPPPPPPRQVATARPSVGEGGPRGMPVAGRIARDFGDATDAGPARGVTISAPPGARVVSPCAGRAVFSGPFRSYGQLLIVDCGEGNHVVLAGFDRLDAATGARLLPGEPVGVMGDGGSAGRPSLYLELRRNGHPADPRPWLAARS